MYINCFQCTFKSGEAHCFASEHTSLCPYISLASITFHSTLNVNVRIYIKKGMLSTVFCHHDEVIHILILGKPHYHVLTMDWEDFG